MTKNIIIGVLGVVIIIGGIFLWNSNSTKNSTEEQKSEKLREEEKQENKSDEINKNIEEKNVSKKENQKVDKDTENLDTGNGIKLEDNKKNIGGEIKFDDNKKDENQNLNFGGLTFNKNVNGISMNDVDITKTVTLNEGEIWLATDTGDCNLSKMKILSQGDDYKKVELTTKSGDKFQTVFFEEKYTLTAKNDVNYITHTDDGNKNVTALRIHYPIRKRSDGTKYRDENSIWMFGGDRNNNDTTYCVDFLYKQK